METHESALYHAIPAYILIPNKISGSAQVPVNIGLSTDFKIYLSDFIKNWHSIRIIYNM
jgi:hypothetical protein